ncbi:MAG: hypothetical protein JHD16_08820 [Solirubrobacteraceae bacterium]|nr:hypothetical protein [Solirubrobacteraceae bacterium]
MSRGFSCRSSRRIISTTLAGVFMAAGALLLPGAAHADRPPFYNAPVPLPDGGPGTLLRAEPLAFKGVTRPAAGTLGWRVLYKSTGATGDSTVVSGALLVPSIGASAVKGVVSVGVGTHGMGDSCAPSRLLAGGAEPDLATMTALLRRGFAVAVTDYQGLGTEGMHTFGVNRALGRNMLDVVRAVRQIPGTGLDPEGKVGITGYSEGGGAAASAAELASSYAPELDVVGSVAGGTLADPERAVRLLDGNWFMGLMLAGAIGYDEAYPELGLEQYLKPSGQWIMQADTEACQEWVARFVFNRMAWYTTRNPVRLPEWKARLRENAVGRLTPSAPVYLYHGRLDPAVFVDQTTRTRSAWCARGANVRMRLNPVAGHFTTQYVEEPAALRWLEGRFAGVPAKSEC